MNTINREETLFLIIDIQEKLVNMLQNDDVKKQAIIIANAAGKLNMPVIVTEQYPKGLGNTISEIKEAITNADYIEKTEFSAYKDISTAIENTNRKQIIIIGIETHICVLQTAFDLLNSGYEIFIVKNACGSRNIDDKNTALDRLKQAGCQIITTEMLIFELLKSSKNPYFKELQALIK